jgi:GH25 family lysozyme M1 (1,4-beta-N-acetylmuramidase)
MSLVDVSEWQARPLDFRALHKDGVGGVYFRIAYGLRHRDADTAKAEIQKARDAGLNVGGYWYALPKQDGCSGGGACNAVFNMAEQLGLSIKPPDLRLALDVEDLNGQSPAAAAEWYAAFIRHMHHHRDYWPVWYVSPGFMGQIRPYLEDDDLGAIKQCGLWEAHYTSASSPAPIEPWGGRWRLWQFTDCASKGGTSPLDLSRVRSTDGDTSETWSKLQIPKA